MTQERAQKRRRGGVKAVPNEFYEKDGIWRMKLNRGQETLVDFEDIEKLKRLRWSACPVANRRNTYVRAHPRNGNKNQISIHRYLVDCPDDKVVDHINHDTLDNRRQNLRVCSVRENSLNRRNNADKDLPKGVYRKGPGKFEARIALEEGNLNLGAFLDPDGAAEAYDRAALRYYKDFAVTTHAYRRLRENETVIDKELLEEMIKELKATQAVLADNWFSWNGEDEYNNDDIIAADERVQALIQKLENLK